MRKITAVLAVLVLAASACGGDDDDTGGGDATSADATSAAADDATADDGGGGGGGGGGDAQEDAADKLLEGADAAGIEGLDEDCVRDKANQLSDADAALINAADADESPTLSPEGEQLTLELATCISKDALVDQFIETLGPDVDADCIRDALDGVEAADLVGGSLAPEAQAALTACVAGG